MTAPTSSVESVIVILAQWLKLAVETLGALLVAVGVCVAVAQLVRALVRFRPNEFTAVRLTLARYLALALEFELGADILGTAVSPSWDQIGKLGAVAVIRTGLNFFLSMEIKQEKPTEACEPPLTVFPPVGKESGFPDRINPQSK